MRYLLLLVSLGSASLVLAQGRPRVPAHIGVRSVTARQVITQELYVDGGATWAGTVSAPRLEADVLDAGQGWFALVGNPDGGEVYAPAGLALDPTSELCLNFPSCTQRIRGVGANILVEPGTGRFVVTDGATLNTDLQAGNTSPNGINLSGGATAATLRTIGGAAPTADAGLILEAGGPDGLVQVTRDAGIATRSVRFRPYAMAAVPACNQGLAGLESMWAMPLADGGIKARKQFCDGEHWNAGDTLLGISAPSKAGPGPFFRYDPIAPFAITTVEASIGEAGLGGGTFELIIRQNGTILCRGGTTCTSAAPETFNVTCTGATVYASPDGGLAHALVAENDGGCASTPRYNVVNSITVYGYPDPGWTAP